MKSNSFIHKKKFLYISVCSLLLTSCATIIGGSKYHAHISVNENPNAEIIYQGAVLGKGNSSITVPRRMANRFVFSVKEKGCEEQKFVYHTRSFRGWTLVGDIFGWNTLIGGVPIFYGFFIDLADGGFWKPNVHEAGIVKKNFKNYQYIVNYTGCSSASDTTTIKVEKENKSDFLYDIVYLKNGSIVRGKIIERDPTQIKLQTDAGSVFVFKIKTIEKISKE